MGTGCLIIKTYPTKHILGAWSQFYSYEIWYRFVFYLELGRNQKWAKCLSPWFYFLRYYSCFMELEFKWPSGVYHTSWQEPLCIRFNWGRCGGQKKQPTLFLSLLICSLCLARLFFLSLTSVASDWSLSLETRDGEIKRQSKKVSVLRSQTWMFDRRCLVFEIQQWSK